MIKRLFDELLDLIDTAKKKIGSLNVSLLLTLALGLVVAVASYFSIELVSYVVIEGVYMTEDRQRERSDAYAEELQEYIDANSIIVEDASAFGTWQTENKYVSLTLYRGDQLLSDPVSSGGFDEVRRIYILTMADGEKIGVSFTDSTENFYYDIFNIIKLVGAVVALFAIMIVYVQRVTARISRLAGEVGIVSGGETERHINISGHDEITDLSHSVEQMRLSILAKIESERAALEANSELITSMSHDIRTPLTVLLGYMEMMKERATDDPTMMEYVLASENTAMRLKRLSDDLFSYFLLFGRGTQEVNLSEYNFGFLTEQMLSEFVLLLSEREYNVSVEISPEAKNAEISTDPDMLMRIVENLLSNMFKYADKDQPITIKAEASDGIGILTFKNTVYTGDNKVETNGIGLKSCRKIADVLGVSIAFGESDGIYTTTVEFKLV